MTRAKISVWLLLLATACLACGDDDELNGPEDAGQTEPRAGRGGAGGRAAPSVRAGAGGRAGDGATEAAMAGAAGDAGVSGEGGTTNVAGAGGQAGLAGVGGRNASAAGESGAGHPWSHCPAAMRGELSDWCAMAGTACDASFDERLHRACEIVGPAPTVGTAAFVASNDCGGRSVNYVQAVDAYNATHHYDAAGALIGVAVSATPCSGVRDTYGMACNLQFRDGPFACSALASDAGN